MSPSAEPLWWDRAIDQFGTPIRADVREAARRKWPQLLALARRDLGDCDFEAQDLLERVVEDISRYLKAKNAPEHDPSGLLVVTFRQELYRLARRLARQSTIGDSNDLERVLPATDWAPEAERHIFLEELVRRLSIRNRAILRLRKAGYEWQDIGKMLNENASTLRTGFWREVRAVHSTLTGSSFE